VLITGSSGFIGRTLAAACLEDGWQVRGCLRKTARSHALPDGVEPVVVPDVGPSTDWSEALAGVEAVVHLAARVHQAGEDAAGGRGDYFRVNTAGTARLARAAADAGVRRLLFMSTVKVHGEGRSTAYCESDPEDPSDPYAESKLEAEHAVAEIARRSGLKTVILRSPLVYGPGVHANFLRLIRLVERQVPLPFGRIGNRRSLIFIGNLASALLTCLRDDRAAGRTFLAADDETVSTPRLITAIAEALGVAPRLFACPVILLRVAGRVFGKSREIRRLTDSLWIDSSRIRKELEWRPPYRQPEGVSATIAWYREKMTRAGS
jgi:nucleoside-diphosphate-sugar epimerase